jgi:hypothetical protein
MRGTNAEAHSAECLSGTGEQAHLGVTPRCGLHAALDFKTSADHAKAGSRGNPLVKTGVDRQTYRCYSGRLAQLYRPMVITMIPVRMV